MFSWKGEWSEKSKKWTPELIEKVNPEFNSNIFWIDLDLFLENFDRFYVSYVRQWNEVKIKGRFLRSKIPNSQIRTWGSKWYYSFSLANREKAVIGIQQEDENCVGVKETRGYVDIGMDLFSVKGG